ncbi:MAG: Flp pilus assembly complex ATPase component TadA [Proteobacteria bacterium]|nr:Flp pilus assembly complex ATPase component TadA [Pseudomonadota bacterium]MBU1717212.1 Flp pilus assembly complex ATPase component TadA [Pseudomonadota bacterium]
MSEITPIVDIQAKLTEADLYMEHGLTDNAMVLYQELLGLVGDSDPVLRAQIEAKAKGAHAPVKSAEMTSPDLINSPQYRFDNSVGLIEAGFHADAIDELKLILDKGFQVGLVHGKIAECLLALDDPFEALKHLELAIHAPGIPTPDRLEILDRMASTYEGIGSFPEALKILEQIAKQSPDYKNVTQRFNNLKESLKKFGRFYTLIRSGGASEAQVERAQEMAVQRNKPTEVILINDFEIDKKAIGKSISEFYKCPWVEFNELEVGPKPACLEGIKEHFWRSNNCVPIEQDGKSIKILATDPQNSHMLDSVRSILKKTAFEFSVGLPDDINKFIDYFHGKHQSFLDEDQDDVFGDLQLVEDQDDEESYKDDPSAGAEEGVVVKVANKIIEEAFSQNASDIHIESLIGKRGALVRFRVDGQCKNYQTIPYNYKRALVSRYKILSKLDIAEKRLPQDGKIKFKTRAGRTIELRVATLPTVGGNEDIVLRILAGGDALPLKKMGILDDTLEELKTILKMPYGLVLVVGPTGSGKTTTLHAALGHINRPETKIWTVEDPVEIVQDGLRQVQVLNKINLNFARVLKAFLRADPDIIMVGETRDQETANTVIEASLTGHLVFSTLHTNSAPETITRLLGMGIDPFNFADSILGVLAQRLIRRLCPHCRQPFQPNLKEMEQLISEYGEHPSKPLGLTTDSKITIYKPKGCAHCQKTGYKGRLAIHELLLSDDELKKLIESSATVAEIRQQAMVNGMRTLKQDGIMKVLQGDTDFAQVKSACIK